MLVVRFVKEGLKKGKIIIKTQDEHEAWEAITKYVEKELKVTPLIYRQWDIDGVTWVDYGSHSQFFTISKK